MGGSLKREHQRRFDRSGYTFASTLRNRICSDSCLKVVYLSCATLISASFIIECILLHLIIVPYLSESVFEEGVCRFNGSRHEDTMKRCENKCSKERSSFPCLQLRVIFTPIKHVTWNTIQLNNGTIIEESHLPSNTNGYHPNFVGPDALMDSNIKLRPAEARVVYLYDYFSTFAAHKASRCSTSPCHRREEDNKLAVEEFKRDLSRRLEFRCYARPVNPKTLPEPTSQNAHGHSDEHDPTVDHNPSPTTRPLDPRDAAAILHRLYTPAMFMHGLLWPGSIFLGALVVLLFTYFADGCEAWAGDKTVIA